jgi:hypothetical protein
MTITVRNTLDKKYMLPGTTLVNPYTEDRDGSLYLVGDNPKSNMLESAILCSAIVSVEVAS